MVCTVPVTGTSSGASSGAASAGELAFTGASMAVLPVAVLAGLLLLAGLWLLWKRRTTDRANADSPRSTSKPGRAWAGLAVTALLLMMGGVFGNAPSANAAESGCDLLSVSNVSVIPESAVGENIQLMPGDGGATITATITNRSNVAVHLSAKVNVPQSAASSVFTWTVQDSVSRSPSAMQVGVDTPLSVIPVGGSVNVQFHASLPSSSTNAAQGVAEPFSLSVSATQ